MFSILVSDGVHGVSDNCEAQRKTVRRRQQSRNSTMEYVDLSWHCEWQQERMTCEMGLVKSGIDRAYAKQHVALPRPMSLSAHRPVSFIRKVPAKSRESATSTIPTSLVEHPFQMVLAGASADALGPCRPSERILQKGMQTPSVQRTLLRLHRAQRVAWRLRLACYGYWGALPMGMPTHSSTTTPYLKTLIDSSNLCATINTLQDHAVELARLEVVDKMMELQTSKKSRTHDPAYRHKKGHILVSLRRLLPGTSRGLDAM